jgi:thiamine biosynthesis lipoprotein
MIERMATARALPRVHVEPVMGTVVSLDIRDRHADPTAVEAAMAWLHDVDRRFSTYRADSEIRRLDRGDLALADASPDIRWVLDRCAALRRETDGFFAARAGGRLDPSALVKGWAAQRAADMLSAGGATDFCLNAGGDVVTRGSALPGRGWRVGVQHPHDRGAIAARVRAHDLAIATSGAYERGAHVVDPATGEPPEGVLSVTVTGPDLGTADAYSTAAFAMGVDGPDWTLGLDGYEAMTILADGTVRRTPGFPLLEERA